MTLSKPPPSALQPPPMAVTAGGAPVCPLVALMMALLLALVCSPAPPSAGLAPPAPFVGAPPWLLPVLLPALQLPLSPEVLELLHRVVPEGHEMPKSAGTLKREIQWVEAYL